MKHKGLMLAVIPLLALLSGRVHGGDLIHLRAAIHIASTVSEGKYSPYEIAKIAQDSNISVVILTDRDLMRWEYGLWPLRNIVKKRVEHGSVSRYGSKRYLEHIEKLEKQFPDMIFIPGIESAPFYYWDGSPFRDDLTMHDWHKHILAIGMEDPQDYDYLPVIGNPRGVRGKFNPLKCWPILLLIVGVFCFLRRQYNYKGLIYPSPDLSPQGRGMMDNEKVQSLALLHKGRGMYTWSWICGAFITALGLLFFLNNWPFFDAALDQYHGDIGSEPYRNYVNYVESKGGLTFWAHPDAEYLLEIDGVGFETMEHGADLVSTEGYTGFSVFYEGYKTVGKPGGLWDGILREYCQGLRKHPVWAIAGLAFEKEGDLSARMTELQTVVLVFERNKEAVLDALGRGRAYVVRGANSRTFSLDNFYLSDEFGNSVGFSGDTVTVAGKVVLHIEGHFLEGTREVQVQIIRAGKVVDVRRAKTPFRIIYSDDSMPPLKTFYRLEIKGKGLHVITNPIFVSVSQGKIRLPTLKLSMGPSARNAPAQPQAKHVRYNIPQ